MANAEIVNVRYLVDDVPACVDFYTRHFGFTVGVSSPAFADVTRGGLRLLLSGPMSSAGRTVTDAAFAVNIGEPTGTSSTLSTPSPCSWAVTAHRCS